MVRDEEEEENGKSSSAKVADLARRILLTGVGAIFMTEGGVRKTLSELVTGRAPGVPLEAFRTDRFAAVQ